MAEDYFGGCSVALLSGKRCDLPRDALVHDSAVPGGHMFHWWPSTATDLPPFLGPELTAEDAMLEERAAAGRFLRDLSESGASIDARKALSDAADAIERGEHRQ